MLRWSLFWNYDSTVVYSIYSDDEWSILQLVRLTVQRMYPSPNLCTYVLTCYSNTPLKPILLTIWIAARIAKMILRNRYCNRRSSNINFLLTHILYTINKSFPAFNARTALQTKWFRHPSPNPLLTRVVSEEVHASKACSVQPPRNPLPTHYFSS